MYMVAFLDVDFRFWVVLDEQFDVKVLHLLHDLIEMLHDLDEIFHEVVPHFDLNLPHHMLMPAPFNISFYYIFNEKNPISPYSVVAR